jgi:hypothetical protein
MRRLVKNQEFNTEAVQACVGDAILPQSVVNVFQMMQIAEEELALNGLSKHKGAFLAICPPSAFRGKVEALYRAHVKELCARMVNDQSIELGTDAECLCAIMEGAARSPLRSNIVQAAERLFRAVLPSHSQVLEDVPERHPEEVNEFIEGLRKQVGKVRFT